jgi:hypothetical protein
LVSVAVAGVIVTRAMAGGVTVIVAVPLLPPALAVIVAVPAATAVTTPLDETVATDAALELHVTVCPETGLPFPSTGVAVSACVPPTVSVAELGETFTLATVGGGGAGTVIVAVAVLPPLVAVMVAVPEPTAVTTALDAPLDETVATEPLLVLQATVWPLNGFPEASFTVAVRFVVAPMLTVADDGDTLTDATVGAGGGGAVTTICDVPLFPSLVAVMVALPAPTAVTSPADDTVATPLLLDDQEIWRPASAFRLASSGVAVNATVAPTSTDADDGVTATDATGTSDTLTVAEPVFPSLVAVMIAVPAPVAVTSPLDDTVATFGALEAHVIVRPPSVLPEASFATAESAIAPPTVRDVVPGVTVTLATDACDGAATVTCAVPL